MLGNAAQEGLELDIAPIARTAERVHPHCTARAPTRRGTAAGLIVYPFRLSVYASMKPIHAEVERAKLVASVTRTYAN